ncbi:MAG: hypothetical protein IPM35_20340 [Myxococcales bacterium]|nr:hypothetical protein [Myxococcales bacterium]
MVAFISVSREEAASRLRGIADMLTALGVSFERRADELELTGARRVLFRVGTCSVKTVGFTSILVVGDEVARWESRDDHSNPAKEVCGSLRPTLATQEHGFMVLSSSPWTIDDYHAEQFDRGNQPDQLVSHAPTWVANPTLTEAGTRSLEPDERTWSREYAAIPSSAAAAVFSADWIAKARARWLRVVPLAPVVVTDPSGGKRDSWTWGACQWVRLAPEQPEGLVVERRKLVEDRNPWTGATFQRTVWERVIETPEGEKPYRPVVTPPFLHIMAVDGETGRFGDRMSADDVVSRIAGFCRPLGQRTVVTDNFAAYALKSTFNRHGLHLLEFAWNNENKTRAVEHAVRLFREGQIAIPPEHEQLANELARFDEKLTPSGYRTFGARGNGHDDFVSVILMAALLDLDGQLPGSPTVQGGRFVAEGR